MKYTTQPDSYYGISGAIVDASDTYMNTLSIEMRDGLRHYQNFEEVITTLSKDNVISILKCALDGRLYCAEFTIYKPETQEGGNNGKR